MIIWLEPGAANGLFQVFSTITSSTGGGGGGAGGQSFEDRLIGGSGGSGGLEEQGKSNHYMQVDQEIHLLLVPSRK